MDRAHWTSPSFRGGRGPHPRHSNPRFRGDGGSYGTPRHFSPHWQQRSPSPYRYQSQQGHRGSFSPHYHQINPYATSTPVHGSGGGRRPFFRGAGGGGRFNKRQAFGSPSFGKGASDDDIESWISPEMWADPWRHLTNASSSSNITQDSVVNETEIEQQGTRFAESDFNVTSSAAESNFGDSLSEMEGFNASTTKFAETDFDNSDSKSSSSNQLENNKVLNSESAGSPDSGSLPNKDIDKDKPVSIDDFEKLATDRIVLDSDEQLLS